MEKSEHDELAARVRVLQLIIAALLAGGLAFACVVAFVIPPPAAPQDPPPGGELLTRVALVAGLVALVAAPIAARTLRAREGSTQTRFEAFFTGTIVSAAILEGAMFFNLVVHGVIERSQWTLAMAGLLWLAIAMRTPTLSGLRTWLERQA